MKDKESKQKIINPEAESLRDEIILALANEFTMVYLTDLDTGNTLYSYAAQTGIVEDHTSEDFENLENCFSEEIREIQKKVVHPDDQEEFFTMVSQDYVRKRFETDTSYSINYRLLIGDTYVHHRTTLTKTRNYDKTHYYICFLYSIDDIIKAEMARQNELEIALTQAKNAEIAKNNLLYHISHELHTPLNAIQGFLHIASDQSKDDAVNETLAKAKAAADQLKGLIDDALGLITIDAGKLAVEIKTCLLSDFVGGTLDLVENEANSRNISIVTQFKGIEHELLLMDELHLREVLMHLLNNAIHFSNTGSNVIFEISEEPCETFGKIRCIFKIIDQGIGISESSLPHIFEPMYKAQTSAETGVNGIGVGLTICKKLLDEIGGQINIESTEGVGTTATVSIDLLVNKGAEKIKEKSQYPFDSLIGKSILLVEDNDVNAEITAHFVEEWGAHVDIAEDGVIGLERVKNSLDNPYDLIYMDIQMPNMNGYEATQNIRKLSNAILSRVPIIALTANTAPADRMRCLEVGMDEHVGKPLVPIDLFNASCKVLKVKPY